MTNILYLKLIGLFCICTFCKINLANAIEISPLFGIGQENFTFEVEKFGAGVKTVKFEPNVAGVTRLGINAFGFGVGYSLRNSAKETKPENGSTSFSDWQLGYNAANWGIDTFYQVYDGFYTANTNAIQTYPNLSFKHHGFTVRYALEESEFSVGRITDQADAITDTSNKVYLVAGYSQHQMTTDVSLLQQEHAGVNTELEDLRALKATSVKLGAGGGKYWVSENKFFIGGLIDLVQTYANYDYESTTGKSENSDTTQSINIKIGGGYAGEKFRAGISGIADITNLKAPGQAIIKPSSNRILIYVRYVFDL
jgi:hypothetical protein